ncbi:putative transcription factor bHLH041 [Oryza glaberrima]|uniref:putative transcription factor bHLH041 n=1 Tax=Oryza glaberrima TaxID=4538 RepID=UPI00224C5C58|nr:putative transcription factor bHLH041 [Oryza glaberrima]
MDEVWCSLDSMPADIAAGIHQPPPPDLHDPSFWPAFADCAASFIAGGGGDNACFDELMAGGSSGDTRMVAMDDGADGSGFLVGDAEAEHLMLSSSSPSSLSSGRSLSIDSAGSMSSFSLDAAAALAMSTLAVPHPYPPPVAHGMFASGAGGGGGGGAVDDHEDAIMRAMMAVISSASASPSSSGGSASSPTPFSRDSGAHHQPAGQPAMAAPQQPRGGNGGHVVVKSSSSGGGLAMPMDQKPGGGGRGRQQEEAAAASATNSSQLYHMMSERKRREKLNDSFHTLRSLLPPCSKKDKTTVLINAAKYLKSLETEITELEGTNTKLEKHIAGGGGAADAAMRARRAQQRAKVQISKAADSQSQQLVNLTVMVMVECDVVELVLHILECLRWMKEISVLSVYADTYSPQLLLKAIANIKLQIMGGDWNEASFHEAMTKAANDATISCAPLAITAAQ